MVRSRTIKVLVALLAAMTFGAFALTVMRTPPIQPEPVAAMARRGNPVDADLVRTDPDVPLQTRKWDKIVVHASAADAASLARAFHFVIQADPHAAGGVVATPLWRRQADGKHTFVWGHDWNADSIGVCLAGDFSRRAPGAAQLDALVALVKRLQEACRIPAYRVYPHSTIVPGSPSPGRAFPSDEFNARIGQP